MTMTATTATGGSTTNYPMHIGARMKRDSGAAPSIAPTIVRSGICTRAITTTTHVMATTTRGPAIACTWDGDAGAALHGKPAVTWGAGDTVSQASLGDVEPR